MGWDRLYVIWREPQTGRRHCIGELWRINVGYAFGYNLTECPWGNNGHFDILPEFPDTTRSIENPYTSKQIICINGSNRFAVGFAFSKLCSVSTTNSNVCNV